MSGIRACCLCNWHRWLKVGVACFNQAVLCQMQQWLLFRGKIIGVVLDCCLLMQHALQEPCLPLVSLVQSVCACTVGSMLMCRQLHTMVG
jgi:hypothetical protein